ncbi:MAG: NAD-dependent succinate-semialdehyde dehydrogenase [Myxococcales bacterium]|nr:NAD-dependent succinate-semialdehyde dehydrogenase [Myxococcales bacterium]MCB9534255.1 NAD-dependent succinate-semialdehyde dehydrogenase [Myxococcales bacterium]
MSEVYTSRRESVYTADDMFRAIDPTTEQVIEEVPFDGAAEVDRKLDRAARAAAEWRRVPASRRAAAVAALADRLDAERSSLAALITREMGKPIAESRAEVEKCAGACRWYAEHGPAMLRDELVETDASRSFVAHEPLGAVLAIMPWNFPIWQLIRFAAPALIAGNVAVLKHAPSVPGCARTLGELFASAGLGDGQLEVVYADTETTGRLIGDPRITGVTLTGSTRAGRSVAALAGAAIKPCVLELGGSDPFVVLADADLEATVATAVTSRMLNCGQSCVAAKRFIVEAPVFERFAARLSEAVAALEVGDPMLDGTRVGPLAREDLRAAIGAQVEATLAAGARAIVGGERLDGPGWFFAPTVLVGVEPGMPAFEEETFGPVAALTRAADVDDALRLAAATPYGLGASIHTADGSRAIALARELRVGNVAINGIVKSDARLPFGGTRASGLGRELARDGMLAFTNTKAVWVR